MPSVFRVGVQGMAVVYTDGIGVLGQGPGVGVRGRSVDTSNLLQSGTGVLGESGSGVGTYGQSTSNAGVYGKSSSNAGVFGDSPLVAVAGVSGGGIGVQGTSNQNAGVYGRSTSQ